MANITISIDERVLRRARVKATEQGTSVNALVSAYLAQFAGQDPAREALAAFLELANEGGGGSGSQGRQWTRDELYDRSRLR